MKGERRDKLKTIVFKLTMPNRILYYPNIAKGERRGNNNIQLVLIKKKKDTCNLVYMTTTACIFKKTYKLAVTLHLRFQKHIFRQTKQNKHIVPQLCPAYKRRNE